MAITQRVRSAPLSVIVDAESTGRYPREVESAVYFCVLEALQNVVKYAGATSVEVTLSEGEGELAFEVSDNGRGFDHSAVDAGAGLTNMADRMDAVGGVFVVESSLGVGTSVRGSVPLRQVATVET